MQSSSPLTSVPPQQLRVRLDGQDTTDPALEAPVSLLLQSVL